MLTFLAGALVAADLFWRSWEMDALLDRVEASEAVMAQLQDDAAQAFEDHGGGADPAELESTLTSLAKDARVDIAEAGAAVEELPIGIWHTNIEEARDAYLAHNLAWQDYMLRASNSAQEFLAPQDAVNETFFGAQQPFIDAVPLPDLWNLMDRVVLIFELPEGESSGGMNA